MKEPMWIRILRSLLRSLHIQERAIADLVRESSEFATANGFHIRGAEGR